MASWGTQNSIRNNQQQQPPPIGGPIRNVYNAAATTQAEDYDNIMGQYRNLANYGTNNLNGSGSSSSGGSGGLTNTKLNFNPVTPSLSTYQPTSDYKDLKNLASTGGYSANDISSIRERDISPIRSIYSSAQQNLARQKSLSGGYSPNAGAATAKMARESSSLIGKRASDTNANIAEMIQKGKLAGLTALTAAEGRDKELMNQNSLFNAGATNQTNQFNTNAALNYNNANNESELAFNNANQNNNQQGFNQALQGVQGQQSLYGTTPALTNTFGNQVLANNAQNLQASTLANNIKNTRTISGGGNQWGSNRRQG